MEQETFDKYVKMISSKDLNELSYCFHSLLKACNLLINEPLLNKIPLNEREHDSSLMIQKTMLHGFSVEKLIEGIIVKSPISDSEVCIYEPLSMVVLCRSLLESFLTFNHINLAPTEIEKTIRFNIWIQYGLRQRVKIERNIEILAEEHKAVILMDKKNIIEITNEIKESQLYEKLTKEKKCSLLKTIKNEWKISFNDNSFKPLSWQNLLENTKMRPVLLAEAYNFLSWYAHSTSVSIYQLRDIHKNEFIQLLLANTLRYSSCFLAMAISDLIKLDKCYENGYEKLEQELKDWIIVYDFFVRGDDYTLEKVE